METEFLIVFVRVYVCVCARWGSGEVLIDNTGSLQYLDCHLSWKLDGYEVRLGTIRAVCIQKKKKKKISNG